MITAEDIARVELIEQLRNQALNAELSEKYYRVTGQPDLAEECVQFAREARKRADVLVRLP